VSQSMKNVDFMYFSIFSTAANIPNIASARQSKNFPRRRTFRVMVTPQDRFYPQHFIGLF
jgi:hypothetical protein